MKSSIGPWIFVVLYLANQAVSQELNSSLHSTLYGVRVAYVDEMVVFTCVVRGSDSMAWTSEEYIGTGGRQLPFAAAEPVNSERRAIGNNQTVATLITAINTGDILIVSELRIRIRSTYPVASVQCISRGVDVATVNSTSFQLADAASVTCDRQFLCPGETTITCVCATGNSNTLAWTVNRTRLDFTSSNAVPTRRDIAGSSGFAVLTENSIVNGIRVITSNITVPVSSNDVILTCANVDQNMVEPITVPTVETCPVSPSGTTPSGSDSADSCTGAIIAAVVIPVIMIVIIVLIVAILIIMYISLQSKLKAKDDRISELDTLVQQKDKTIRSLEKDIEPLNDKIESLEKDIKEKNQQLEEKEKDVEKLKKDMADLAGESGKVKKLEKERREALKKLPAKIIMTTKWKEALKTLESQIKTAVLSTLKENITAEIGKAAPEKEKSGGGSTKKGSKKSKIQEILKDLPAEVQADYKVTFEKLESIVEGEQTTVVKQLKDIVMAEIDKAMPKRETSMEPKSESKKRGSKSKESSVDEATRQFKSKMEEEINMILEEKKESMLHAYVEERTSLASVQPAGKPSGVAQYLPGFISSRLPDSITKK